MVAVWTYQMETNPYTFHESWSLITREQQEICGQFQLTRLCQHVHKSITYWQNSPTDIVDIFNCIFLNENDGIPIQISLKYVPRSPIDNKPALVQVMAWRRIGDMPLSEPMLVRLADAYMRH